MAPVVTTTTSKILSSNHVHLEKWPLKQRERENVVKLVAFIVVPLSSTAYMCSNATMYFTASINDGE